VSREKVLCIIPARAGSKGIPGKNIKKIEGQPLICWTINQALKSRLLDKVIVSTDGEEIAEISRRELDSRPEGLETAMGERERLRVAIDSEQAQRRPALE
jgi:CMP-N-acetylneuraminic acid synthetase